MSEADRRGSRRLKLILDCTLEVIGPPEYVGMGLLRGQTINITEHGVMVMIPGLRRNLVEQWQSAVDNDQIILFQVSMTRYPAMPLLKGQIAWTNWKRDPETGPAAYIGLLFQILADKDLEALREILSGLSTEPDLG